MKRSSAVLSVCNRRKHLHARALYTIDAKTRWPNGLLDRERAPQMFEINLLENKAPCEQLSFHIFDLFLHREFIFSLSARLYREFRSTA